VRVRTHVCVCVCVCEREREREREREEGCVCVCGEGGGPTPVNSWLAGLLKLGLRVIQAANLKPCRVRLLIDFNTGHCSIRRKLHGSSQRLDMAYYLAPNMMRS
jgi:hypothetical protein